MEHNRKQKLLMIVALVLGIASLSVGFAAFSVSLNISSSANVTPSSDTFSVKFSTSDDYFDEGPVVPVEGLTTSDLIVTNGVINNSTNPTLSNLSVTFTKPNQTAVYKVYAKNTGKYTAYLNSVNFLGDKTCAAEPGTSEELVQSACENINIYVIIGPNVYGETTAVSGHVLEKNFYEEIMVILEYNNNGVSVDGPFSITFPNIALVYSTIDDSSIQPTLPTKSVSLISGDLNTPGSIVSIGDEQFYVIGQEDGNVKLLSMYNLYVGNQYDDDNGTVALSNPTGIQNSKAIGGFDECSSENPIIGTTAFSSDSQKGTNYNDYNGSIVEGYVNNYASYLEGLGANIEEARLITKEELETLGCSSDNYTCSGAPEFVYKTSYWSGSAFVTNYVWFVHSGGVFGDFSYSNDDAFGVRPVIIISTSLF